MMVDHNSILDIISYNCRGYNTTKRGYLVHLLEKCQFLFLQEHWLANGQLPALNNICDSHNATAVSGFGSREVLRGRPYGGCAIVWPHIMDAFVDVVDTESNRMCAVHVSNDSCDLLLINVYMPAESTEFAYDEFCTVLAQIAHLTEQYPNSHLILGGDFNVDFLRCTLHSEFLNDFCTANNIYPAIRHDVSAVDYTYQFCMERFSTIDHFFVSSELFRNNVRGLKALHDIDNCSDHDPLLITLQLDWTCRPVSSSQRIFHSKPAWYKATDEHYSLYKEKLYCNLSRVIMPTSVLSCRDVMCNSCEHEKLLKSYANDIVQSCIDATCSSIPMTGQKVCNKSVPGWSEHVAPL